MEDNPKQFERKVYLRKNKTRTSLTERIKRRTRDLFDRFEAVIRGKDRMIRQDGVITGTSESIGKQLRIPSGLVRVGFIVGTILFWPTIFIYLALTILIPKEIGENPYSDMRQQAEYWDDEVEPRIVDIRLCEHCNTALRENAKFCHNCGAEVK